VRVTPAQNVFPATGNVGIGTASPVTRFEINNGNSSSPTSFQINPNGAFSQFDLYNTTTGSNTTYMNLTNRRGVGQTSNGGASQFGVAYDASLILPESGVNQSNLLLRNDDVFNGFLSYSNYNTGSTIRYESKILEMNSNPGQNFVRTHINTNQANHYKIVFDNTEVFRVSSNGNVGVGTTNTGSFKLAVEGKIGAREVNVTITNPWPDYVFEPTYDLKSLTEIETYIKENKHLPELPTAKEMETNGVQLGEMNMLLLKKIEEMTLLMIELKKELEELKEKSERLESKINK
jgi:hypothetical protein